MTPDAATAAPPADRLFLDANVLFSAAWSPGSALLGLWALADAEAVTGATAAGEAVRNAINKPAPDGGGLARLAGLLLRTRRVPDARDDGRPLAGLPGWPAGAPELPAKDRPVLLTAAAAGCSHLLTGDKRHFGPLWGHAVAGVRVLRPADYLAARPAP